MSATDANDNLIFAPEEAGATEDGNARRPWKVAIIDDAPDVHSVTRMVLKDVVFRGRPIEFFSAYSASEGKRILAEVSDLAAVFLDVVMESDQAGLDLVEYIRNDLGNKEIRIILRTGQPGQAPETEVIVKYDINDYKHKSELSAERLFTTLIAALRSYQDLMTIETSREGLHNILQGTAQLFKKKSTDQFLSGVLMQLNAIFQLGDDAMLYVRNLAPESVEEKVMAASGKYTAFIGRSTTYYEFPQAVREAVHKALQEKSSCYQQDRFSIYFYTGKQHEIVIYIDAGRELNELDTDMIDIFCSNVSAGLNNVHLLETLEQKVVERTRELAGAYATLEHGKRELEAANEQLRLMAMTDPLTGVFNRRYLMEVADRLFNAGKRYQWDLAVLLIDIDHFKLVNDTYGHAAGDEVLVQIARLIRNLLRDADVFGRIGGEEFVIIVPHADAGAARLLGERLMQTLSAADIRWNQIPMPMTVSVGVAVCQTADKSVQAAIERADGAMYRAKQQGRNQIVVNEYAVPPQA
jgi:two-component system cell cycle response regulator